MSWVAFGVVLPHGGSAELDVDGDGHLRVHLGVQRDDAALTLLGDALRAAVIDVDAQRAIMAVEGARASR